METDDGFTTSEAELDSEDEDKDEEVELCMFLDQAATIQKGLQKNGRGKDSSLLKPRDSDRTTVNAQYTMAGTLKSHANSKGENASDLDFILGALNDLECQLDWEQQAVTNTLKRRKSQSPASPSQLQPQPLSLPLAQSQADGAPKSAPTPQRRMDTVMEQVIPAPAKWAESLDVQLQDALLELSNFVGVTASTSQIPLTASQIPPTTSQVLPTGKSVSKQPPVLVASKSTCYASQQTPLQTTLPSVDMSHGRCDTDGAKSQTSPVRRLLKPQQKSVPEWSVAKATDEQAGKAEMMQRFIELSGTQAAASSPEADSGAFCDNFSLPSSSSRASVLTTCSQSSIGSSSGSGGGGVNGNASSSGRDPAATERTVRFSSERPSLLIDPKEATKVPVKVLLPDGAVKSVMVNSVMTVAQVLDTVQLNFNLQPSINWSLIEDTPDLYMERLLEDHEYLLENLSFWSTDSRNRLLFIERPLKYDIFLHPEIYLLKGGEKSVLAHDRAAQKALIDDFFADGSQSVPEVEGVLYIKSEGKKAWKKLYFVLRASGLYYNPKGKGKTSKDLICLQTLDIVDLYIGVGWKKKYKSPTDYCFALKHPQIQKKAPKYIKYLCAEDPRTFSQWVTGIRLAKTGRQMLENYRSAQESISSWSTRTLDMRSAHNNKLTGSSKMSLKTSSDLNGNCQMGRTISMPHVQASTDRNKMVIDNEQALKTGNARVSSFSGKMDEYSGSGDNSAPMISVARSESCLLNGGKLSPGGWRSPHPSPSPSLRHAATTNSVSLLTVDTGVDVVDFPPPPSPNTLHEIGLKPTGIIRRPSSSSLSVASRTSSESLKPPPSPVVGRSDLAGIHRRLSSSSSGGFPAPPPPEMFNQLEVVTTNYAVNGISNHMHSFYGPSSPNSPSSEKLKTAPPAVTPKRVLGPSTSFQRDRLSSSSSASSRSTFNEELEIALSKKSANWKPEDDIIDGGKCLDAVLLHNGQSSVEKKQLVNGNLHNDQSLLLDTGALRTVIPSPLRGDLPKQQQDIRVDMSNANSRFIVKPAANTEAQILMQQNLGQKFESNGILLPKSTKPSLPTKSLKPAVMPSIPVEIFSSVSGEFDQQRKKPPPPPPKRNQETRLTTFQ